MNILLLEILPISREILKGAYQQIVMYYTFKKTVELLDVPSRNTVLMSDTTISLSVPLVSLCSTCQREKV